jgi:transposase-like protein
MASNGEKEVMKKSRFTEEQMVTMLREADKTSVAEVSKKYGVSDQTIYNWRQHFGGMDATDVKRLKQLEQENARLKKILAATTGLTLWFMTHLLRSCMCQPELCDAGRGGHPISGERVRETPAGCLCEGTGPVGATSVRCRL